MSAVRSADSGPGRLEDGRQGPSVDELHDDEVGARCPRPSRRPGRCWGGRGWRRPGPPGGTARRTTGPPTVRGRAPSGPPAGRAAGRGHGRPRPSPRGRSGGSVRSARRRHAASGSGPCGSKPMPAFARFRGSHRSSFGCPVVVVGRLSVSIGAGLTVSSGPARRRGWPSIGGPETAAPVALPGWFGHHHGDGHLGVVGRGEGDHPVVGSWRWGPSRRCPSWRPRPSWRENRPCRRTRGDHALHQGGHRGRGERDWSAVSHGLGWYVSTRFPWRVADLLHHMRGHDHPAGWRCPQPPGPSAVRWPPRPAARTPNRPAWACRWRGGAAVGNWDTPAPGRSMGTCWLNPNACASLSIAGPRGPCRGGERGVARLRRMAW